ncbi:MAG: class I SAM-dependent methyltransferase [Spirochaetales bacterium]|nr:class I SAM-dependent methyltransferase [Spirochaetales bacterium]
MDYMDKDLGKILKNNAQTLRHEFLPEGTDCFRVYDRNLSRYPVTVDLYGKYAKVTDYGDSPLSDQNRETLLDICSRMLYLEKQNVVYAFRNRRAERQQHEKSNLDAVRTTVHENGLLFAVDLTSYVDTGLFLDHAKTRRLIRDRSENKDVLNLFSYTGSFSVYAASGMANSVTSVDMSATYTKWAKENLEANGYEGDMYKCICMDATKFVSDALEKGLKYDIIIFDPPSFSNSRKMDGDFDVARDYVIWIKRLFGLLKKTGFILFSTNLGSFQMDKRRLRSLSIKEITGAMVAPGFVKGRAGTVRSWMMAFDDDSLSLDWSEPEKKSEKGSDSKRQAEGRPAGRREGERRSYDRKPSDRYSSDRRSSDRRGGERRRYDDDRPQRSERRYDRYEKSERSDSSDRPRRFDRQQREDRPYRSSRDNGYERSERYSHHDRFDDGEQRRDRFKPRSGERSYDRSSDREFGSDRPRRDRYERTERPDREDRPFRRERSERDDRPRERSYDRDRSFGAQNRRSYGEKRDFQRQVSSEPKGEFKEKRETRKTSKKPYGYDSFKPARSREDSSDFFWNEEDLKPKK